ncbi:MAG: hypothetical protein C0467_21655 [Planctomycetaceae bacterium]|nr:hypothetical protein [Planctomycetaceae bacterium]
MLTSGPRILFTAPWDAVAVRRGDALGLRALADQFADALAPDLSNRVRDGRWVTILAWCLTRSQEVFHAGGGISVATRVQERQRYAWLRPLELMWVGRTIALAEGDWRGRQLAGQRRVKTWYVDDEQSTDRFGMSVDQYRAYRQTGMYGGYRLAFRKWPGMTARGDGWTPGPATIKLANWLDERLGIARPAWRLHAGDGDTESLSTRSVKLCRGEEHGWWCKKWPTFDQGHTAAEEHTLPRRKDDFSKLPEAALLEPLIFGQDPSGSRRREVACEVATATASGHLGVCEQLGRVFASDRAIALLPKFSRLADAGMVAMDLIAKSLRNTVRLKLTDGDLLRAAEPICEELVAAAKAWPTNATSVLSHIQSAHRFADGIRSSRSVDCLAFLLEHHELYGGGLRWFVHRNGWVEPRTPWRGGSSRYRFRLWSLCRLATQCGVLGTMPRALAEDEADENEGLEAADE